MLSRADLAAERAASRARQAAREAERASEWERTHEPYRKRRFGNLGDMRRKAETYYDDLYVPPMDVTEVLW